MSTKTNFKRIALVAVAALGLGVLSSVPSQAVVSNLTVDVTDGTATTSVSDTTTAATVDIKALIGAVATDSVSVVVVLKSRPATADAVVPIMQFADTLTGSAVSSIKDATSGGVTAATAYGSSAATTGIDSATSTSPLFISNNAGSANTYNGFTGYIYLDTATISGDSRTNVALVAGTYVITVVATPLLSAASSQTAGVAVSKDVSIVVSAIAANSKTATATYSFSKLSNVTVADGASDATDSTIDTTAAAAGITRGYLFVAVRNASNGSSTAQDSLTATVTGVGLVCTEGGVCGRTLSKVAATGDYLFTVQGDGSGGTSTITVTSSVTGLTYTHSLTYYGSTKTITASTYNPVLTIGANTTAVAATAVDTTGANWAGKAYIYASSATDALVAGSATTPVLCSYDSSTQTQFCPVTAIATGTAKLKVINASTITAATVTSNEVTVTVRNGIASTVKLAFNKASYAAGEKAFVTVTVLDEKGLPLQGASYSNLLASGGISSSYAFASGSDTLTASDLITAKANSATTPTTAGSYTYTVYMPTSVASVTISATGGTGLPTAGQVKVSATATVSDNASAALAAVTALATTVASLKTLITTLTNLVLKIQKKVKA